MPCGSVTNQKYGKGEKKRWNSMPLGETHQRAQGNLRGGRMGGGECLDLWADQGENDAETESKLGLSH